MLKSKTIFSTFFLIIGALSGFSQNNSIDSEVTAQYFQEAKAISDSGNLWGEPIYGPMIFADPKTRAIIANQADSAGYLKPSGNVFTGTLPKELSIANTAFDWAGRHWTMVVWPLPEDKYARAQLMMHELFHRIQGKLGFPMANPNNAHLDEKQARILLQLEWQSLVEAINADSRERARHIRNALVFRKQREAIYPEADSLETALELNEGLAEYTGVKLSGRDEAATKVYLAKKVEKAENLPTFVRSFAYTSGPLYGYLLDLTGSKWRKTISPENDFPALLSTYYQIELPDNLQQEVTVLAAAYNGAAITEREEARAKKQAEKLVALRKKFEESPVVNIPLQNMSLEFDPNNLQPLGDLGTVYPHIRASDNWGVLTVTNDALLNANWTNIAVSAVGISSENEKVIAGDGWELELEEGWELVQGERDGGYLVRQIE